MAATRLVQKHVGPTMTSAVIFGLALYPTTNLHAELPERQSFKKPIYDDSAVPNTSIQMASPPTDMTEAFAKPRSLTPTDNLSMKIREARLFLHGHVSSLEDKLYGFMDSAFTMEESLTSTIASIAPAPHTGEKVMPGLVYVLVTAMTGSIVARKYNILLRATLPLATGIASGSIFLPVTLRNVSDLVWRYEQRFPVIADTHIRSREAIERTGNLAKSHSEHVVNIVNNKVSASRSAIEDWVKQR